MEKVTDLFKAYRNKDIEYEELFGTLTQMLSDDPQFSSQAVHTLDSVQQFTPIPITDFINLRAQLESTAETFHQQESFQTPADQDGTLVYTGEDATASPSDPTLINSPPEAAAPPTAQANHATQEDYGDEATVIMPMPARQPATAPNTAPAPNPAPVIDSGEIDEHATIVATPQAPMQEPAREPEPIKAPEPTPVPAANFSEVVPTETPAELPETPAAATATHKPQLPLLAIGAGAIIVLAIVLVVVIWPSAETDEQISEPTIPATQETEDANWNDEPPQQIDDAETEIADTYIESDILEPDTTEEEMSADNELPMDVPAEISEPVTKDEAYFSQALQQAVEQGNLTPAESEGTATYFLVELIKLDPGSQAVTDARTVISRRHQELAKEAQSRSQWDLAQKHLDDAFKVLLPDSYLPTSD